jgi:hypothetical protein
MIFKPVRLRLIVPIDPFVIPKGLNMNCTAFFAVRLEEMDVQQPQRG